MTEWVGPLIILAVMSLIMLFVALIVDPDIPWLARKVVRALKSRKKAEPDVHALLKDYYTARHHEREIARTQWEREFATLQVDAIGDRIQRIHKGLVDLESGTQRVKFSRGGYVSIQKGSAYRSRGWSGHDYVCECRYCVHEETW